MIQRAANYLKFRVERFILRGASFRFLFIAIVVVLVSSVGGVLAWWLTQDFGSRPDAIWWAFLRLTDPGYLGDDEGAVKRVISTLLTLLGYVLFMGALIAIMTQALHEMIARLQSGFTPIVLRNHFLILGWNDRTPVIVEQLLLSTARVRRFLSGFGAEKLNIVILAEQIGPQLVQTLKDHLGPRYQSRQITFRSGSPLQVDHLERVDFLHAAAILLPAGSSTDQPGSFSDSRVIKTLTSVGARVGEVDRGRLPVLVAEISDARNFAIARRAYGGPIEVLAGDRIVSRLIAQNVRHRGVSWVFTELFSQAAGNQVLIREAGALAGRRFGELNEQFAQALLLGVTRSQGAGYMPWFNPPADAKVGAEDRLILIARSFEACQTSSVAASLPAPAGGSVSFNPLLGTRRRVLVLGWNHKLPALIREFEGYGQESFELTILSLLPETVRKALLRRHDALPEKVRLCQIEGDYTSMSDLKQLAPARFDNIVLLASDRLESDAESEARTVHGYLVLQEVLGDAQPRPAVLVELMTPENLELFHARGDEVLVTPLVLSHLLTQVALRRELSGVFEELFGPDGADIHLRPLGDFLPPGRAITFRHVQRLAAAAGEIALGFRLQAERKGALGGMVLNPDKDLARTLRAEDEVVVLTGF